MANSVQVQDLRLMKLSASVQLSTGRVLKYALLDEIAFTVDIHDDYQLKFRDLYIQLEKEEALQLSVFLGLAINEFSEVCND